MADSRPQIGNAVKKETRHWYTRVVEAIDQKQPFRRFMFDSPYQPEDLQKEAESLIGCPNHNCILVAV